MTLPLVGTLIGQLNIILSYLILSYPQVLGQHPTPFFLNIDFFPCKQHFATLYVSLDDIYTINTSKQ